MKLTLSLCCINLLLVLDYVWGKPVSDIQSLKQILSEMPERSSEETQDSGGNAEKSKRSASGGRPWGSSDPGNSALEAKADVLAVLFKDLFRTSKRSWGRFKKGRLRSCFGVRLDRIGSFSGLGC
ncbi:natriuretic peptide A-like [Syngnathoides biaculeatus]|uniref:natriuretic peptide A-like n=1 Tax=Syngnathoides biaculeatus TaxID=300417 RepID=UPI002ADD6CB4|nr:natriuretic peptide A-like [Syngnathoides biaculeatus]